MTRWKIKNLKGFLVLSMCWSLVSSMAYLPLEVLYFCLSTNVRLKMESVVDSSLSVPLLCPWGLSSKSSTH